MKRSDDYFVYSTKDRYNFERSQAGFMFYGSLPGMTEYNDIKQTCRTVYSAKKLSRLEMLSKKSVPC